MEFCFECGEKLPSNKAKFCPQCGTNLQNEHFAASNSVNGDSAASKAVAHSKFKLFYHLLTSIFSIYTFFFTVFFTVFFSSIVINYVKDNPHPDSYTVAYLPNWIHGNSIIFVIFGFSVFTLVWVIFPLVNTLLKKLTYAKTEYRIYENYIEYREGFLNENYSKIDFHKVIEVHLRKGFIQKRVNLGTIFIEIPGSGKGRNGINLRDLPNYEEIYNLLKKLVQKQQNY